MMKQFLAGIGVLACLTSPALAVDSVSIEVGNSFNSDDADTDMARVGVQWNWDKRWELSENWFIGGYWDLSLGYWHTSDRRDDHNVVDVGFTPTFRLQRTSEVSGVVPYAEFAIGAHYLSDKDITDGDRLSTNFQFGDHVGFGLLFGEQSRYDLSYRVQHLSNGGIDHPNPGINFNQLRFQVHF